MTVHSSGDYINIRVVKGHGLQALRSTDQVEEEYLVTLNSMVLKDQVRNLVRLLGVTFNTEMALRAEPAVASIGSTRITNDSLMFLGSFL